MDQPRLPDQSLEAAQLEKLKLEIRDLKKKSVWRDTLLQLVPALTILGTVIGFGFTVYQFYHDQQKARATAQADQKIRIQSQIRTDLDQLVQFPTDKSHTIARVVFLLQDLANAQGLAELQRKNAGESDTSGEERRRTSQVFGKMILYDIQYNEKRDVDFANTILTNWEDFKPYLVQTAPGDPPEPRVQIILIRYLDALNGLHSKFPAYLAGTQLDATKGSFNPPQGLDNGATPSRDQFRHFENLINSFPLYLNLLSVPDMKNNFIKQFQAAICNRTLTQQKLGLSFEQKDDSIAFKDCDKPK